MKLFSKVLASLGLRSADELPASPPIEPPAPVELPKANAPGVTVPGVTRSLPCPRRLRRQLWRRQYDGSAWDKIFRNRSPFDWRDFTGLPQRRTNSPSTF